MKGKFTFEIRIVHKHSLPSWATIMEHSTPFIKIISILLLIARFVKNLDPTIIQIIRKNKSSLIFFIKC